MQPKPLYAIVDDILAVLDNDDLDDAERNGALKQLQHSADVKIENTAAFIKNCQAEAEKHKKAADEQAAVARAWAAKASRVKDWLHTNMERAGITVSRGERFNVALVKNSQPTISITDDELVPDEFKTRIEAWKVSKTNIARAIKATGEVPPGVEAHVGTHLRIG